MVLLLFFFNEKKTASTACNPPHTHACPRASLEIRCPTVLKGNFFSETMRAVGCSNYGAGGNGTLARGFF